MGLDIRFSLLLISICAGFNYFWLQFTDVNVSLMAAPSPPGNMKWVFSVTALERCTGRKTNRRAPCTSSGFLLNSTSVWGNKQKREKILKRRRARRKEPHLDAPGKQCLMLQGKVQGPSLCEVCRSYASSCAPQEESQLCRRNVSHEQPSSDPEDTVHQAGRSLLSVRWRKNSSAGG